MENNFYVGLVHHCKTIFRNEYDEKLVLYNADNDCYLDLISGVCYSTDKNDKNYVLEDSLIVTDINEHKTNYIYLLSRYKDNTITRKKKI